MCTHWQLLTGSPKIACYWQHKDKSMKQWQCTTRKKEEKLLSYNSKNNLPNNINRASGVTFYSVQVCYRQGSMRQSDVKVWVRSGRQQQQQQQQVFSQVRQKVPPATHRARRGQNRAVRQALHVVGCCRQGSMREKKKGKEKNKWVDNSVWQLQHNKRSS